MKVVIVLSFVLTIVGIYISTATEKIYVVPDNSTNSSCPSQPCATLSQYLLSHNGTLPVVSNVEYHFLPGEHHVPANMTLQNLHNFSIIGITSNLSSPVVLAGCSQSYVMNIINSCSVIINSVMFKQCNALPGNKLEINNLRMFCCFSCKIQNVILLQYGFTGVNMIGETYLNNIKIKVVYSLKCCQGILLEYNICPSPISYSNQTHEVKINQLLICKPIQYREFGNAGLCIDLDNTKYNVNVILANSSFYSMDRPALQIKSRCYLNTKKILVINCTFRLIYAEYSQPVVSIVTSPFNKSISFVSCVFHENMAKLITVSVQQPHTIGCIIAIIDNILPLVATNIRLIRCWFMDNSAELLIIDNKFDKANVWIESLYVARISSKTPESMQQKISITNMYVHIKGPVDIIKSKAKLSIMHFQLCDIKFSGKITFDANHCSEVILLDTYITVVEHTNITFINNRYYNKLIDVKNAEKYNQPNPYCLFQYVAINNNNTLQTDYVIIFKNNHNAFYLTGTPSQNVDCSISFCQFIFHCKWLSSAAFHNYSPEAINKQIIQNDDQRCSHHKHICYCPQSNETSCRTDILGPVYPGQTLQTNLCNMCSNNISTVLYAEVHHINVLGSACKVAHQSQLINVIGNHSNTVDYTIVSDSNRCELFLSTSPFLNKIYDTFYVELLPCPIGFTLQNGICDCDPILPEVFDKCYIDYTAIKHPANTWITAHIQDNITKYLVSDCPMDYCLPYSSNITLLHSNLQCQFNRTGVLCSQCQSGLSMVFGSSRCMECTNLHILITIIVIVAGIVLVVLLYLLNLTVTTGTINGIIFYANIISINDSVFLVNDNVFKPLRVFISFTNLDLGIETCFYNGMDGYVKMWLQLFFPFYLIIIAGSIIIASRYSSRILRLTYTRSLPVLATLFLLSYTGVLRTVLTVLFSYSTITHLPSGHQQIVWSIDASVPLFGLKFTVLFITCLMLFLLLLPFNITLLFTRFLSRFSVINRFKPLLDAFQGSYKDKFYYWIAVQINLRSMVFALYGFQTKLRLIIATVILILFTVCYGYTCPHKNKLVNIQELLLLINLTIMHAVSYQSNESIFSIITNVMIGLAFLQFCVIVLHHVLTYTFHCNIVATLQAINQTMRKKFIKKTECHNLELLNVPKCTYNYAEYQDGLV